MDLAEFFNKFWEITPTLRISAMQRYISQLTLKDDISYDLKSTLHGL